MAHIIEVVRGTAAEARPKMNALFYSETVSASGQRHDGNKTRVIAVNGALTAKAKLMSEFRTRIE